MWRSRNVSRKGPESNSNVLQRLLARTSWRHESGATRTYRHLMRITAAFILCVAIGSGWFVTQHPASSTSATLAHDYATHRGQRATITLADGSTVFPGPESHLRVAAGFGSASRDVSLSGVAVFTIVHAQAKASPFLVHAGNTVTQVLGTTFAVRNYMTDAGTQVVVAQGESMVDRTVVLSTGDLARSDVGRSMDGRVHHTDIAAALDWTQSKLNIRSHAIPGLSIPELERQYEHRRFESMDTSIAAHTITASFSTQSTDEGPLRAGLIVGRKECVSMGPTL